MPNRIFLTLALLGTLIITSLFMAVMNNFSQTTPTVFPSHLRDIDLSQRVETLLDTDINLVGSKLRVVVNAAIVTISGIATDEHAMHRALTLASSVHGVNGVQSAMEIELPK